MNAGFNIDELLAVVADATNSNLDNLPATGSGANGHKPNTTAKVDVPDWMPRHIASAVTSTRDRSHAHHVFLTKCVFANLNDDQIVQAARLHLPSVDKYGDRLDAEVRRSVTKARQWLNQQGDPHFAGYKPAYIDSIDAEAPRDLSIDEIDRLLGEIEGSAAKLLATDDETTTWRDRIVDGATWLRTSAPSITSVWGDETTIPVARNQPTIIAGAPGVSKTTMVQQLVLGTIGVPGYETLLGWPVLEMPDGQNALILASDRPDQARLSMMRMIDGEEAWETLEQRLRIWTGPPPESIAKRPSLLLEMAQEAGSGIVVVDSLKDLAIGLSDDEVGARVNQAHQYLAAAGIDVVTLHHPRKRGRDNADARWTLDDLYGSAWIGAGAGSVIFLEKGPTSIEATQVKSPNGIEGTWRYTIDLATGGLAVGGRNEVLAAVEDAGPTGITTSDVARWVLAVDKPTSAQVERVRRELRQLEETGMVERTGAGNTSRWVAA